MFDDKKAEEQGQSSCKSPADVARLCWAVLKTHLCPVVSSVSKFSQAEPRHSSRRVNSLYQYCVIM